jgi:rare lipoprotein A
MIPQRQLAWLLLASLVVTACTSEPFRESTGAKPGEISTPAKDGPPIPAEIPADIAAVPEAVPKTEPHSATGNPESYVALGQRYEVMQEPAGFKQRGYASWYGKKFHGKRTSSGERYDMFKMTAAHKTLPIPCYARVTNLENGKTVIVRLNDRGPFHSGRIIDLSYAAAVRLDMLAHGEVPVQLEVIQPDPGPVPQPAPALGAGPAAKPAAVASAPAAAVPTAARPATAVAVATPATATVPAATAHAAAMSSDAPAAATATDAPHFLQAGAFNDPINAATLREQLRSLGVTSVQLRSDPQGTGFSYRVLVGPFLDTAALEATRLFLANKQFPSIPVGN